MRLATRATAAPDQFERIYRENRERLFAFLVYRTGDRTLAEDLLGDVFERAFRARARFDPRRGSETTWLYAIAVNRLRDHQRRAQVERVAVDRVMADAPIGVEQPDGLIADRDRVMQALSALNERDRAIIALRFGADLTVPQIARVTEQPLTTVEGRLFRALRKLHSVLEPEGADEPEAVAAAENGSASRGRQPRLY